MLKTVIAIDFDGTIVTEMYPLVGEEIAGAIESIKRIQSHDNVECVLWTCRSGQQLDDATSWLADRGVHFRYVNCNTDEGIEYWKTNPRKIAASIYIDDKSVGGFVGWKKVIEEVELFLSSAEPEA
jgi:rhodanese-related sulfurtransferase